MKADFDTIKNYLTMDRKDFDKEIKTKAFETLKMNDSSVYTGGLLALTNVCVNNCHYCGLNRNNGNINRFTLDDNQVLSSIKAVKDLGLKRLLLIGGENPKIKIDQYLKYIEAAKKNDLEINLAMGVFSKREYKILKDAGLDYYTIKFEVSNPKVFNECNPDILFEDRMKAIREVKEVGLKLGTGSIVGLKNQSLDDMVNDILLTKELEADWAPIVPFIPAPNSIMGDDTPFGNVDILLRSISLIRLLLPNSQITAGQPTQDSKIGFGDEKGNIDAMAHGANKLFVEVTPLALQKDFEITEGRKLLKLEKIDRMINSLSLKRK
ncbi:MAG: radical SAM protein [Sphaerochaetaceae bacterium]|nr:radical SAM protein [Sphaerochaetaceae bacterium]